MRKHALRLWALLWVALLVFTFVAAPAWDFEGEGIPAFSGSDAFLGVCLLALFGWPLGVGVILALDAIFERARRSLR